MQAPDPKWHLWWSLVKSALRMLAGTCMVVFSGSVNGVVLGGVFLIIAEVVGVIEEI